MVSSPLLVDPQDHELAAGGYKLGISDILRNERILPPFSWTHPLFIG